VTCETDVKCLGSGASPAWTAREFSASHTHFWTKTCLLVW